MKKRGLYILLAFMSLFIFNGSANAACKDYGNSGKDACLAQAEDGFKCEYNASRKGVARCYKGDTAADEIIVEPSTSEDNNTNDNSTAEDNEPCNRYASQGENYCKSQSYNGYKCAWDINKKGGARCYQSKYLTDEKKNELTSTVNSCSDIKDASVCNNSKVKGVQCFYTHHVCANKTDSDGSNSTVIGDGSTDNSNSSNSSSSSSSSSNNNQTSETDSEYYTRCPLGVDVTKDLYGILKIVKIVAPLLVIALTILDLVRALAKGDIQGESKKLVNHFIRRSILAVILFFLPVLINQAMILADIWDENGTCDFSNSVTINENNKNNNEDNKDKCSSRSANQRYCENKSGCKWNSVTNTCGEATTTDYRKENCDGYYDATSDECVKKSNITCATFSGEKAKCKNLSKSYGLASLRAGMIVAHESIIRGVRNYIFQTMDSSPVMQGKALAGAFNASDLRYQVYREYFNPIVGEYMYRLELLKAMVEGIESVNDLNIRKNIEEDIRKLASNEFNINHLLEGIPDVHFVNNSMPESGFFALLDYTNLKNKEADGRVIKNEIELLKYMYEQEKIKIILGQSISFPNSEQLIGRVTTALPREDIIDHMSAMNRCLRRLR